MDLFKRARLAALPVFAISMIFPPVLQAADTDGYQYPELHVTPLASERLELEAKAETSSPWTSHVPIQVSALTTLTASIMQLADLDINRDPEKKAPIAGLVISGAWLTTTVALSILHTPYSNAAKDVGSMPRRSQREQLVRERMAEEALRHTARLGRQLTWLSVITNAAAGGYLLLNAKMLSLSMVADCLSIVAAFTPVIFPYHWQSVNNHHQEYKKRIYAPVARAGFVVEPVTRNPAPGLTLSLAF